MIAIGTKKLRLSLKRSLRVLLFLYLMFIGSVTILIRNQSQDRVRWSSTTGDDNVSCHFTKLAAVTEINVIGHHISSQLEESRTNANFGVNKNNSVATAKQEFINVFVVLHSHVDPGWMKTFDEYYYEKVHSILSFAVLYLNQEPSLRFIWSETSFLEKWWQSATEQQKSDLRKVVKSGQFEVTGGAWVMTDEATPYYWASIDNLIEGHQFLASQLNVKPTTSWSVDPFGHGAMMPYLLNLAGVKKMAIGRINYAHKASMREKQQLVFRWRQSWDVDGFNDNWVHTLPRTYYSTWDTCGPDRQVCCQFEFGPSVKSICPQRHPISAENIAEKAEKLSSQYRRTAAFYRNNILMVTVGADFYLSNETDWTENIKNYGALFAYINSNPERFAMKLQFGTLSDYFSALGNSTDFPTLSGDFFPYTDNPNSHSFPWWTGYFTTRPFHKRLERIIQSRLRGTDLLSAFSFNSVEWRTKSVKPRRDLALFQHHDAITGTSRAYVMDDYLNRLLNAQQMIKVTASELVASLVDKRKTNKDNSKKIFLTDITTGGEMYENSSSKPLDIPLHERVVIVIFNQLTRRNMQVVRIMVLAPTIKVVRISDQAVIMAQINPIIRGEEIVSNIYEIVFLVDSESLSLTSYELRNVGHLPKSSAMATIGSDMCSTRSKTSHFDFIEFAERLHAVYFRVNGFRCETLISKQITIANEYMSVVLEPLGYLQNATIAGQGYGIALRTSFWSYADSGGAYTFKPIEAKKRMKMSDASLAISIRGTIVSEVTARISEQLTQVISLYNSAGALGHGIHITLRPNLLLMKSTSMVARIETESKFGHKFFTDVNGLYLLERKHDSSKPIEGSTATNEANYYPVSSAAVIQNFETRITLLSGQPCGAASDSRGSLEVMIDRTVNNDDGKGLGAREASVSPPSELKYMLMLESRMVGFHGQPSVAYHSRIAQHALEQLLYPPVIYQAKDQAEEIVPYISFSPVLPYDVELINIRPLIDGSLLMLLRRLPFDCAFETSEVDHCDQNLNSMETLINALGAKSIEETTLTGTTTLRKVSVSEILSQLSTMDVRTYRLFK